MTGDLSTAPMLSVFDGRTLTRHDFTDAPVNQEGWNKRSDRLADRLTAVAALPDAGAQP